MAEKEPPDDDLDALLGETEDPLAESQEMVHEDHTHEEALKGVTPSKAPWNPVTFADAAYNRSRYGAEWNERVAEADDETIAETFALASRLLKVMREELAARLTQ